ncbi:MAG: hypothetical protein EAX96_12340 [Candidatus Lokiarchaeota archaeon]|nr:hypothetical protein [Candidatus Lokiarchaeota archaeon]
MNKILSPRVLLMKQEKFTLKSNNETISGVFTTPQLIKTPISAVIICHGIPSMEGKNLAVEEKGYLQISDAFAKNGFISLVFNFQGCKGSTGKYSPLNWVVNLNSIIEFVNLKFNVSRTFVLSFSGGAMISVMTVAKNPKVNFLITCACPSDLTPNNNFINLLGEGLLISFQEQKLNKNQIISELEEINPLNWVNKISPREILILHGKKDDLIPPNHSKKLFTHAKEPKKIYFFENLGHKLRRESIVIDYVIKWCLEKI